MITTNPQASKSKDHCPLEIKTQLLNQDKLEIKQLNRALLERILGTLKHAEYLKQNEAYKMMKEITMDEFQSMPITTYKDYRSLAEKQFYEGGKDILSVGYPVHISKSGGSTGEPKFLPYYAQIKFECAFNEEYVAEVVRYKTGLDFSSNSLGLDIINKKVVQHSHDVPVGFLSTQLQPAKTDVEPLAVKYIGNHKDRLMIALIVAMECGELQYIRALFLNIISDLFFIMQNNYKLILQCIKDGKLPEDSQLDEKLDNKLRSEIQSTLKPNESRYLELADTFNNLTSFKAVANKIWPSLRLIHSNHTGAFEIHVKPVEYYINKQTTIVDLGLGSSECGLVGEPIGYLKNHYLMNRNILFEYIDLETGKITQADELQLERQYEIVVTNINGWVRYNTEDVMCFRGWYLNSPVMSFLKRKSEEFKIDPVIITQQDIVNSIGQLDDVRSYMCYEDSSSRPSRYGFYVELFPDMYKEEGGKIKHLLISKEEITEKTDSFLKNRSFLYQSASKSGRITSPISLRIVKPETFSLVREFRGKKSNSPVLTQIKLPVFTRNAEILNLLSQNIVE